MVSTVHTVMKLFLAAIVTIAGIALAAFAWWMVVKTILEPVLKEFPFLLI